MEQEGAGMKDKACPFCGSNDIRLVPRTSAYDVDKIYCDGCKTEISYYPTHIATMWNRRTETDAEHCPFCGGEVEFDGVMNHSMFFSDAYCPTCGFRFEFQNSKLPKSADRKEKAARKAFGRRAK